MTADAPTPETDVLIVGAGPTGLVLANLLGTMAVRTTVVERNLTTVAEPRAVSIDDESMRTIQAIGLDDVVESIVSRGYGSRYLSPSGRCFATVDPIVKEYGFDKRNGFQQPDLESVLREGLRRFPTVQVRFGCEFENASQSPAGVVATLQSADGSSSSVAARFLVACDGARSPVRSQLGIQMVGSTFAERWLIVDLVKTSNRFRHTEVFCNPRRPCISLPGPGGIRRYEFMLKAGEDEPTATSEAFVRGLLADVGPDRDAEFRRVRVYTFHARLAESWRDGRIFLAGDAAHLTPPFAGQGMNSGLRDAHNLGWKLAEALSSETADPLLDSYEVERRPHAWDMITLALRMGRVMMPSSRLQAWLTRTGFDVLGLYPPAREYFAQMRYKPPPRFRQGLLWQDGRAAAATMVGRLLPQPIVETAERKRCLLDRVLPDRPVVLVFDENPDRVVDQAMRQQLEALGATVVGLTPEWMNPNPTSFPIVRDVSRFFNKGRLAGYLGHAFLLRRDRYVAATAQVGNLRQLAGYIPYLCARRPGTGSVAPDRADGLGIAAKPSPMDNATWRGP